MATVHIFLLCQKLSSSACTIMSYGSARSFYGDLGERNDASTMLLVRVESNKMALLHTAIYKPVMEDTFQSILHMLSM